MKLIKLIAILSFLALFVFACSQATNTNNVVDNKITAPTSPTATPDELAAARTLYTEKCVKCHKENGTGGISTVDGKKIKAADFKSDGMKKETEEDLAAEIKDGVEDEGMPSFAKELNAEQIKSLVKFIRKEFQGK